MDFDLEYTVVGSPDQEIETIKVLFLDELDHMPLVNFSESSKNRDLYDSFRQEVISLIMEFRGNSDPFISYLAVNYIDRFVTKQGFLLGNPQTLKLLAASSLSLAAKMKNGGFSISDLQREGFIFDAQTIERMELHVLGVLQWRLRSITPFSFVSFFISILEINDPSSSQVLKERSNQIIFSLQYEVKFLEHKPSIIAASAVIFASRELFYPQHTRFVSAISTCVNISKADLFNCCNLLQQITKSQYETASSSDLPSIPNTPIPLLERHYVTSEIERIMSERETKRRKLEDFGSETHHQLSQIRSS